MAYLVCSVLISTSKSESNFSQSYRWMDQPRLRRLAELICGVASVIYSRPLDTLGRDHDVVDPNAAESLTRIEIEAGKPGCDAAIFDRERTFNMTRHGLSLFRISLYAGLVSASLISAILAAQPARTAEPIRLNPGYVSLLKLDQTISTIVIGNPDIVDATLQGKNAILLTAKK